MLSTGLLIGAPGAIACADEGADAGSANTGSSSSASPGKVDSSPGKAPGPGAGPVSKTLDKAIRDAIDSVTSAVGAHTSRIRHPDTIAVPRTKVSAPATTAGQPGATGFGAVDHTTAPAATDISTALESTPSATAPPVAAEPTPMSTSADANPAAGSPAPPPVTHAVTPLSTGGSAHPAVAPSQTRVSPNLLTPTASALVGSLTGIAASLGTAAATAPGLLWSLPTSPTPIADVIEYLATTLTAVTGAVVPLIQLPGDLAGILLSADWTAPVSTLARPTVGSFTRPAAAEPALPPVQWPTAPGVSASPQLFPGADAVALGNRSIATAPILNEPATLLKDADVPEAASADGTAFIKGAVTALLVSVSLWALFTAALPGLGGLAAISATGVRIGYRQANAGAALRATGLLRFAAGGPIGVVRSDSMVSVRVRPQPSARSAPQPVQLRVVVDNVA